MSKLLSFPEGKKKAIHPVGKIFCVISLIHTPQLGLLLPWIKPVWKYGIYKKQTFLHRSNCKHEENQKEMQDFSKTENI